MEAQRLTSLGVRPVQQAFDRIFGGSVVRDRSVENGRQVRSFNRLAIASHPFPNGVESTLTGKADNPLTTVVDQMLRSSHRSLHVVGYHGGDRRITDRAVDCNHRNSYPVKQVAQCMTVRIRGHND